jgi:hypothetical protein
MDKLIIYIICYILLIILLNTYFTDTALYGYSVSKINIIVVSLVIPFLILVQWLYNTIFNIDTVNNKNITLKMFGILIGLAATFSILFIFFRLTSSYVLTKTNIIIASVLLSIGLLFSLKQPREALLYISKHIYKYTSSVVISINNLYMYILAVLATTLLITISIYYKKLFNALVFPRHKILISSPLYLNNETLLGTTENLNIVAVNKNIVKQENQHINYNYSLSFQVYMNPQGKNTRLSYNTFAKLIDFGENPTLYFNSSTEEFKLEFYVDDSTKSEIIFKPKHEKLYYQKWNSIVLNIIDGGVDVFINNVFLIHDKIPNKFKIEKISIGEKKGIEGGIKNVVYYEKPLGLLHIKLL